MSGIFGALGLNDTDRVFRATVGQDVIYQEATRWVAERNAALNQTLSMFVERETENHKERYKLPGGGRLQRRSSQAMSGAVRAYGSWDVAFPLEEFGAQLAGDRVTMAYMTVAELSRHIETVVTQNINTVRFEVLKALFNSAADTFADELWGSLTIQPLANGDSVVYPPVLGSESEATDNHYLESGYAAANISDTNDPYVTMIEELAEHFGESTGGDNIVVFINQAQAAKTRDLTDFDPVVDRYIQPGAQTDVPFSFPMAPGTTLGRHNAGCWIQQWRWIPANYMLAIHMDEPAPLVRRVDPADTGLARGLALISEDADTPFEAAHWSHRFGFGVGNRLNGVVMELGTGGSYGVPTAYQ